MARTQVMGGLSAMSTMLEVSKYPGVMVLSTPRSPGPTPGHVSVVVDVPG